MSYPFDRLLILLVLGLAAGACSLATVISPTEATHSSMMETQVRIHQYMLAQRDYPRNLQTLPVREGYANQITDGCDRELIYSVDDDGVISLTSLGRDARQGGSGDDADITKRFRTRSNDGSLNIDNEYWILESEIHDSD